VTYYITRVQYHILRLDNLLTMFERNLLSKSMNSTLLILKHTHNHPISAVDIALYEGSSDSVRLKYKKNPYI
jgi:hypothetical protein